MYRRSDMGFRQYEIQKVAKIDVAFSTLRELCDSKYLISWAPPDAMPPESDYDDPDLIFQISDYGKAYLEALSASRWKEFRNWASLLIALAAFLKSFFF